MEGRGGVPLCRGGILCRVLYKGAGHPALPAENRLPDHIPEAVSIWGLMALRLWKREGYGLVRSRR